jgi:hypothetical protein
MPGDTWLTFPDGTEHDLKESVTIGRDTSGDLAHAKRRALCRVARQRGWL